MSADGPVTSFHKVTFLSGIFHNLSLPSSEPLRKYLSSFKMKSINKQPFYWRSNGNKKGHTSTYVVNQCYRIIESAHCQIWKYRSHIHFALIFLAFLITRLVSNNLSDLVKTVIDCPKKAVRYFAPNFDKNARTYEKESRYREWVPCSPESAINIIWCCWLHPCLSWGEQKGSRTELPDIFNGYSPSLVSCNRLD